MGLEFLSPLTWEKVVNGIHLLNLGLGLLVRLLHKPQGIHSCLCVPNKSWFHCCQLPWITLGGNTPGLASGTHFQSIREYSGETKSFKDLGPLQLWNCCPSPHHPHSQGGSGITSGPHEVISGTHSETMKSGVVTRAWSYQISVMVVFFCSASANWAVPVAVM